jgi:hypothetical protein
VAKVRINGETFDFDRAHKPLSEMVALERAYGAPYGQWEHELEAGSAKALGTFIWLVWRRDGRDIPLEDILSGEAEVDLNEFEVEQDGEGEGKEEDPTPPAHGNGPSNTGRAAGSSRSPASASGRGKSSS